MIQLARDRPPCKLLTVRVELSAPARQVHMMGVAGDVIGRHVYRLQAQHVLCVPVDAALWITDGEPLQQQPYATSNPEVEVGQRRQLGSSPTART